MARSPFQSFLDISYRSQEHVLVVRWLRPVLSHEEFRSSYYALLDAAIQSDCRFWILDIRRRQSNCDEQTQWILNDFCSEAVAAFRTPGQIYATYLVAPDQLAYYAEIVFPTVPETTDKCFQVAAFDNEGFANAWLKSKKPLPEPGLVPDPTVRN